MSDHEKDLLRWYLKDKSFRVDDMPDDILNRCYEYCSERLAMNGDYSAAFESLLHTLLTVIETQK